MTSIASWGLPVVIGRPVTLGLGEETTAEGKRTGGTDELLAEARERDDRISCLRCEDWMSGIKLQEEPCLF